MAKKPKAKVADTVVETAKKRFAQAKEFYGAQRMLAIADTEFVMGDSDNGYQWPDQIQSSQDASVRLTVNVTAQHCNQIINNIRENRPQAVVTVADSKGHEQAAEVFEGMIRAIQRDGSGDDATDCAAEHAVYGGEGYWYIVPEYDTDDSVDQVLRRKIIQNPNLVYIDPYCKELDKSDAEWGFVFEDVTREEFERLHPDIDPASWSEEGQRGGWADKTTVRIAAYCYCEHTKETLYIAPDGTPIKQKDIPQGIDTTGWKSRVVDIKKWKWCKLVGGEDKPVDETDWLGKYLPIIAVVGKELNINGEVIRKGVVRDLKDPARMLNYAYSATVQTLALQNKIPYMAAAEAIKGYEMQWAQANMSNDAYLPFNAYTDEGDPLPKPERQQPAVMPGAQIQLLQLSTEQMQAASGQQNVNFGIKSEAQSGIGIQRLKVQGDIATFHFPDNLARALKYEVRVLLDAIPKYYDTNRMVNIVGLDDNTQQVVLAPDMNSPYHEDQGRKAFNPKIGRYDVTIKVGASYATQRQAAAEFMSNAVQSAKDPATASVLTYLAFKYQDMPGAAEADKMLKVLLPQPIQQQMESDKQGQPIPPEVQQQLQEQQQHLEQATQTMQAMEQRIKDAESGEQTKQMEIQAKTQREQEALQAKREQAQADYQLTLEKAQLDNQAKKEMAAMDLEAKKEIAEMQGYFELEKARLAPPSPNLTADVEEDFVPEKPATRKRLSIMGPSGQVYHGMVEDVPNEIGVQ